MQRKNLLILSSRYPHKYDSISASFVYNQVNELKEKFEEVVVISTTPYIPKFLTRWMNPIRRKDSLAKDYSYDNVRVFFTRNMVSPFNFLKKYKGNQGHRSTKKILQKINFIPDIIHSHFTWPSGYIGRKLKEELGIPLVITIHENHNWLVEETSDSKIVDTWKAADALIRVNRLDVSMLKKFNKNVYSIPNGYNHHKLSKMDKIKCREKLNLPENKKITFSLGHLNKRKGFDVLIDSIKMIDEKIRNNLLVIIGGNGSQKAFLEKKIIDYKLESIVRLEGFIDDSSIPLWFNSADFFILPSFSEGNPTVMFESLGCGRPFIGTNVGGIPEVIINNKLGLLTDPGDPSSLKEIIVKAIHENWDNEYIYEYSGKFTWREISGKIYQLYEEM